MKKILKIIFWFVVIFPWMSLLGGIGLGTYFWSEVSEVKSSSDSNLDKLSDPNNAFFDLMFEKECE